MMAQDVCKQWDVTHIPEELQSASATVPVLAASINPKLASALIRDLGVKAPLTSLAHVKRIQKIKTEELRIILCVADGDVASDTLDIPNDVADIVEKHSLVPFLAQVSAYPASNRKEWEAQCLHWPTSFHPNACLRGSKLELDETEAESARKFMKEAIHEARLAHSSGQLANGAVIVDPYLGSVIARAHDQCTATSEELLLRHPLRHAVMEVIAAAAHRDRLLFPSKQEESDDATESASKKARMMMQDQAIPRPYLCTGFDAYITREPCAMCAMALVHQRVRRVFFGVSNPFQGALGSKYRLQGVRSLNHHYMVFHVSIGEAPSGFIRLLRGTTHRLIHKHIVLGRDCQASATVTNAEPVDMKELRDSAWIMKSVDYRFSTAKASCACEIQQKLGSQTHNYKM